MKPVWRVEESIQGEGVCKGPEVGKNMKETSEEAGTANEEAPRRGAKGEEKAILSREHRQGSLLAGAETACKLARSILSVLG